MRLATLLLLLAVPAAHAQLTATLTTDQEVYEAGEPIDVTYTITNSSNSTEQIAFSSGSPECQAFLTLDTVEYPVDGCTLLEVFLQLPAGTSLVYRWSLDPASTGLPDTDGTHTVQVTSVLGVEPSVSTVTFEMPAYRDGGLLHVAYNLQDASDVIQVREALNAEVLRRWQVGADAYRERWQIHGVSLDSALTYADSAAFTSFEIFRDFGPIMMEVPPQVSTAAAPEAAVAMLGTATPNPFRQTAALTLTLDRPQHVRAEAFDAAGRRVAVLHDGALAPGERRLSLDGRGLAPGVYSVRAVGDGWQQVQRVTLVR